MYTVDNISIVGVTIISNSNELIKAKAFEPGDYEEIETYIGGRRNLSYDEWSKINIIWTPEVIAAWKQKQAENEIA